METRPHGEKSVNRSERTGTQDDQDLDRAFENAGWNEEIKKDVAFSDAELKEIFDVAGWDSDKAVDLMESESQERLERIEPSEDLPGLSELRAERDDSLAANSEAMREAVDMESGEAREVIDAMLADGVKGNEDKLAELAAVFPKEVADALHEAPIDDAARQKAIEVVASSATGAAQGPNPELFSRKLYLARNIEGKPNFREIAELRKLEDDLSSRPEFVSVAPFGSVFRGYGNETSDIDTYVLYDGAEGKPSPEFEAAVKAWEVGSEAGGREKHAIFQNVNPDQIISDLRTGAAAGAPGEHVAMVLSNMTRIGTGEKIKGYREKIRTAIMELPEGQRRELKNEILDALVRKDTLGLAKRKKRLAGFSDEDHQQVMHAREEMWRKRVESIWG